MDKPAQNIQDSFLNNARKEKGLITIYLLSGVKLSGRIKSFDKYSLVLETNNQEQLIFKHAISTVVSTRAAQQHPAPHPNIPVPADKVAGAAAAVQGEG
jgi:host factor-I protein